MSASAISLPVELREIILEAQSRATLASCAVVCHKWNEVASSRLWRKLSAPFPLLQLLAPLAGKKDLPSQGWSFAPSDLAIADWKRFAWYASKVVSLTYDDTESVNGVKHSRIAPCVFSLLQSYRPADTTPLLPNLYTLSWHLTSIWPPSLTPSILPFLSQKITSMDLSIVLLANDDLREALTSFCRVLRNRTPNLRTLAIRIGSGDADAVEAWDDEISVWLSTCKNLRAVTLPRCWHCPDMLSTLGSLPYLEAIDVHRSEEPGAWVDCGYYDMTSFLQHWRDNPTTYPSLKAVGFDDHFTAITEAFQSPSQLARLDAVSFGITDLESGEVIQIPILLTLMVGCCVSLQSICIDLTCTDIDGDWPDERTSFQICQPLLSCSSLAKVELKGNQPIRVLKEEITEMGRAWPNLVHLKMEAAWSLYELGYPSEAGSWDPNHIGTPAEWLSLFAANMPNLEYLGIDLHPNHQLELPSRLPTFKALKTLSMGVSPVPPGPDLAFFFAALLPPDAKLSWNIHRARSIDQIGWRRVEEEFGRAGRIKRWNFGQ